MKIRCFLNVVIMTSLYLGMAIPAEAGQGRRGGGGGRSAARPNSSFANNRSVRRASPRRPTPAPLRRFNGPATPLNSSANRIPLSNPNRNFYQSPGSSGVWNQNAVGTARPKLNANSLRTVPGRRLSVVNTPRVNTRNSVIRSPGNTALQATKRPDVRATGPDNTTGNNRPFVQVQRPGIGRPNASPSLDSRFGSQVGRGEVTGNRSPRDESDRENSGSDNHTGGPFVELPQDGPSDRTPPWGRPDATPVDFPNPNGGHPTAPVDPKDTGLPNVPKGDPVPPFNQGNDGAGGDGNGGLDGGTADYPNTPPIFPGRHCPPWWRPVHVRCPLPIPGRVWIRPCVDYCQPGGVSSNVCATSTTIVDGVVTALAEDSPIMETKVIREAQVLMLPTGGMGEQPGTVLFRVGDRTLPAKMLDWNANDMTFQAPTVPLSESVEAYLTVSLADGQETEAIPITFAPATAPNVEITDAVVGSQLTIQGRDFGSDTGSMKVTLEDGRSFHTRLIDWAPERAQVTLPDIDLDQPTDAEISIRGAAGQFVDRVAVRLLPR